MSIINQILKDLERRRARPSAETTLPRGGGGRDEIGPSRFAGPGRWLLAAVGLIATALATIAVLPKKPRPPVQIAARQPQTSTVTPPAAPPPAPVAPVKSPPVDLQTPLEIYPPAAEPDSVEIAAQSEPAGPGLPTPPTTPNTKKATAEPAKRALGPTGGAKAAKPRTREGESPMRITRPVLPPDAVATARRLVDQGYRARAAEVLDRHLAERPDDSAAREELAALYRELGWTAQSEKVLREGLDLDPGAAQLAKDYAQRLLAEGKNREAEAVLERAAARATTADKAESMASLAAVYLRNGHSPLAERLYRGVLAEQPRNGAWRMGLTISLEQQGKKQEALETYQEALYRGDLAPLVQRYVAERIEELRRE